MNREDLKKQVDGTLNALKEYHEAPRKDQFVALHNSFLNTLTHVYHAPQGALHMTDPFVKLPGAAGYRCRYCDRYGRKGGEVLHGRSCAWAIREGMRTYSELYPYPWTFLPLNKRRFNRLLSSDVLPEPKEDSLWAFSDLNEQGDGRPEPAVGLHWPDWNISILMGADGSMTLDVPQGGATINRDTLEYVKAIHHFYFWGAPR